jgi:hypothetical protein
MLSIANKDIKICVRAGAGGRFEKASHQLALHTKSPGTVVDFFGSMESDRPQESSSPSY